MKISLIHPTHGRPELGTETMKNWCSRAKFPDKLEYIMILSEEDSQENIDQYRSIIGDFDFDEGGMPKNPFPPIKLFKIPNGNYVTKSNFGASIATGDLFIIISDDVDCPHNWDELLLEGIEKAKTKKGITECFTVKCKDGIQPFLQTMPVVDRKWYEKFGYILYKDFVHMYSDSELSCVSYLLDRTLYVDLLFQHNHYTTGKKEKDTTNEMNDSTFNSGSIIFGSRAARNFDLNPKELVRRGIPDIYKYHEFENY